MKLVESCVLKLVYIYSNYKLQMPREIPEWKGLTNELDKNTSLDRENVDDKIQIPGENEESENEDEYLLSSSSESEEENFNDNEIDLLIQ